MFLALGLSQESPWYYKCEPLLLEEESAQSAGINHCQGLGSLVESGLYIPDVTTGEALRAAANHVA